MTATSTTPDVIDVLVGVEARDALDAIRARRSQARVQAQQSYLSLFEPPPSGGSESPADATASFTLTERFALATFVAALHGQADLIRFYADGLARQRGAARAIADALAAEAADASSGAAGSRSAGPYGSFPPGPLSAQDEPGPAYRVGQAGAAILGSRLSAALVHAHMLVFHPRDANAADLQALLDAGWSTTEIVTLSQLVAFLAFQIRVVAGLQTLRACDPRRPASFKPQQVTDRA
jgi:CMD domain protein